MYRTQRRVWAIPSLWGIMFLAAFVGAPADSDAKQCRKGQPCGNSCISWNKVCRSGSGSSYSSSYRSTPSPAPVPTSVSAPTAPSRLMSAPVAPAAVAAPPSQATQTRRLVKVDAAVFEWPEHDAPVLGMITAKSTVVEYRRHKGWIRITPENARSEWMPITVLAN